MIQPGIVAAQAASVVTPITREYFAVEQPGEVSGSDASTNVELARLTATLSAGNWVIFWTLELQSDGFPLEAAALGRVAEDGVEIEYASVTACNTDDEDGWGASGGFYIHAGTGVPVAFTIDVRSRSDVFTCIPRGRNGRIVALKLTGEDEYAENAGQQTDTTATPVDAATLAFTPGSPGSYVLLGYAQVSTNVGAEPRLQISDGVDNSPPVELFGGQTTEHRSVFTLWPRLGLSSAQTVNLQFWDGQAGSPDPVVVRGARLLALRLDGFTHVHRAVSNAAEQGPETTYTDSLVLSRRVRAADFMTLGAWSGRNVFAGEVGGGRLVDPLGVAKEVEQVTRSSPQCFNPGFTARIGAIPAGQRAWSIQRVTADASHDAEIAEGAVICAFQLT